MNRELQHDILLYLKDFYFVRSIRGGELEKEFGVEVHPHLFYLQEHGLISASTIRSYEPLAQKISSVELTAKGLDFLADDGGLSAILDKVTFKLDEEQFNDILTLAVDQSTIPTDQKPALKKALETAGHSTITNLIAKGIDSLATTTPDLLTLLAKAI